MTLRILIPIDVEEKRSWTEILPELRLHAKGNSVELTCMTVVPDLGTVIAQAAQAAPFASFVPGELKEKALEVAQSRLGEITETEEIGIINRFARSGNIYSEVLQTADELSADLIILMSHIPDFGDYLLGPNAAKIVRHANCSVLVIRPKNKRATHD
ncbi:Universal stress protein F [Pseudovibrio sp. Ad46]|uniref:universal stress protein n=1 Tax=Pseudovibrio sp. Ad46 TaxID=989432 RepID=UPI0007AECEC3|nr:universal stress protein [Pseudovibrio sp. Ad46]KZK78879.1 Universal stress protein F [Pseudovibrio sp. Ad46]